MEEYDQWETDRQVEISNQKEASHYSQLKADKKILRSIERVQNELKQNNGYSKKFKTSLELLDLATKENKVFCKHNFLRIGLIHFYYLVLHQIDFYKDL